MDDADNYDDLIIDDDDDDNDDHDDVMVIMMVMVMTMIMITMIIIMTMIITKIKTNLMMVITKMMIFLCNCVVPHEYSSGTNDDDDAYCCNVHEFVKASDAMGHQIPLSKSHHDVARTFLDLYDVLSNRYNRLKYT